MKKIRLKRSKKKKFKLFKFILLISIVYITYYLSINNINNIKDKEYVNYLLTNSYDKKSSITLLKESLKLVSNIDLSNPSTLLPSNIKNITSSETYNKDAKANDDDYNVSAYEKITSYIENPNKEVDNPIIYLYNTHQLETYSNIGFESTNVNPNVLMTSYLLAEKLNKNNINTIVEDTNISEFIRISNIEDSDGYNSTRIFLKEKMSKYNSLKYYIDIHRDSVSKDISTCTINNKNYARVLFVVGTKNENYTNNKKIMEDLDTLLDKYYNGISRGIYERKAYYNQDLNNNIILIEVGAKDNTIEEVTNTIDALGDIITKYINGDNT